MSAKLPKGVTREMVFNLRGRILKGDRSAIDEMIAIYVQVYPRNAHMRLALVEQRDFSESNLKIMYLHLDRAA